MEILLIIYLTGCITSWCYSMFLFNTWEITYTIENPEPHFLEWPLLWFNDFDSTWNEVRHCRRRRILISIYTTLFSWIAVGATIFACSTELEYPFSKEFKGNLWLKPMPDKKLFRQYTQDMLKLAIDHSKAQQEQDTQSVVSKAV